MAILVSPVIEVVLENLPDEQCFDVSLGNITIGTNIHPNYTGGYEVTPSQEQQILETKNTVLSENIVVNPIPENYGLITWNGAFIRVS